MTSPEHTDAARDRPALPLRAPPPRWVHAGTTDTFWVSRGASEASVVAGGARLALGPDGVVRAASWEADLTADPILGALAVPPRLGEGYVLWSRGRVFRAATFTGPLEPVATPHEATMVLRGARPGLRSVIVFTDAGARSLARGSDRLEPSSEPGLADVVASSAERAVVVDVFGRARATASAGARWTDLTPLVGVVHQLVVGPDETWLSSATGRWLVDPAHADGGALVTEHVERGLPDAANALGIAWSGAHLTLRDDWGWPMRDQSPLAVTVAGGAPIGDGTAFGVVPGLVLRVDLATGKLLRVVSEWLPSGLVCDAHRAPDGVLFACLADRSQGYGAYVLRSVDGAPPVLERAFSDDGIFVAGDDGALGFAGSCLTEPRLVDPRDPSRAEDPSLAPVLCVRTAPGVWTERRVSVPEDASLAAWVPRRDGSAAALLASTDPLPPPVGARRAVEEGGVTVVRVVAEVPGYALRRWSPPQPHLGSLGAIDRRFEARDDGSLAGWLPATAEGSALAIGCTIDRDGAVVAHDAPPGMSDLTASGAFAIARGRDQRLYETTDHGRTWRAVGTAPAPPSGPIAAGCSALGCTIGPVVRVGWGLDGVPPRVSVAVATPPTPPLPPSSPPVLACAPRGLPDPLPAPPPAAPGERESVSTGWGDTLAFEGSVASPDATAAAAQPAPPPRRRGRHRSRAPAAPPLHPRGLRVRHPFAPFASAVVLAAPNLVLDSEHTEHVVPLLEPSGDVSVLVAADEGDVLIAGDKVTWTKAADPHLGTLREALDTPGLALPGGQGLVLLDTRRRLAIGERGGGISPPPIFVGSPRLPMATYALGRRDDGAVAVILAEGGAAGSAGAAIFDRVAGALGPIATLAAWTTVATGADPRCAKAEPGSWRAILMVDPASWLTIDQGPLPRTSFAHQGLLRVRWGATRVCLEAIDAPVLSTPREEAPARDARLVVEWSRARDRGAALRSGELAQELACSIGAAP